MPTDYKKVDAAIMASIDTQPKMFSAIFTGAVETECTRVAGEKGSRSLWVSPGRILDRRLQSLRKAGKIRSTSKGWIRADA